MAGSGMGASVLDAPVLVASCGSVQARLAR